MPDPAVPATAWSRLLDAALLELRTSGYETLTIRRVARHAGVSSATAYNYFASKEHLFAALNARMIRSLSPVIADDWPVEQRLGAFLQCLADAIGPEPALQAAFRAALLGTDPDARRVRDEAIDEFVARFEAVCGTDLPEASREDALLTFVGAMVLAGLGRIPFHEVGSRVARVLP